MARKKNQKQMIAEWFRKKVQERKPEKVVKVLKKVVGPIKRTKRGYVLPAGIRTYGVETRRRQVKQKVKAGPGRPAGVYKHISPLTGQKVPATTYYKHVKETRRKLRTQAQQVQIREQATMARRGVPPQVTRMRQMQRIQQPQQLPVQISQQYPQQIPIQQFPFQRQQQFRVVTDIMTGRRIIKQIPPRERWTMKGG